ALALLNGRLVGGGTSDLPGSALDKILRAPSSDSDKITALYLRTVSRPPTPDELQYFTHYVSQPQAHPPTAPGTATVSGAAAAPSASAQAPQNPTNRGQR